MTPYKRLQKLVQRWGGTLERITPKEFKELVISSGTFADAPFAHNVGVDFKRKRILWHGKQPTVGNLIHEVGHVFASKKEPFSSDEWSFFGWEHATARYVGAERSWFKASYDYYVEVRAGMSASQFGRHTRKQQLELISERTVYAKKHGLIGAGGKPRAVR